MSILEPMTVFTDLLLAGFALGFAWRLRRRSRYWAIAFVATAFGAVMGAWAHGRGAAEVLDRAIWKATVFSIGVASFFLLAGVFVAWFGGTARRVLIGLAAVQLVVYTLWMTRHDDFVYVIADYGSAMVLILLLALWKRAWWIVAGILVSFGAAGVQMSGIVFHKYFNFNDLYHLIQIGALYLLYRGAPVSAESSDRP